MLRCPTCSAEFPDVNPRDMRNLPVVVIQPHPGDSESDVLGDLDDIYLCPFCFVDRTEPAPRRTVPCRLCSAAMSIEHSLACHKICVT